MKVSNWEFLLKVFRFLKPYWYYLAFALFFSFLASLTSGGIAWMVKPVMDRIFIEKQYSYLKLLPLGVICFFFLKGTASLLQAYFMRAASLKMINDLRVVLYRKILHLPLASITREGTGRHLSRVLNDTLVLEPILSDIFKVFLLEGLSVIALLGVAFSRSPKLTLVSLLLVPIIVYGARRLGRSVRRTRKKAQTSIGELSHRLTETLTGIREVKVFGRKTGILKLFRQEIDRYALFILKITKYREGSKSLVDFMTGIAGAVIIAYGGSLIVKGELTPGAFFSVLTAILMLFTPVRKMARAYTGLSDARAAWERIEEVLVLPEEKGGDLRALPPKKRILFENVSFCYPGTREWALKEVFLEIPVGRVTALVGPSGAGKSTLVSLIPRFYDPNEGRVLFDDTDIKEFDLESLRSLIGLVSQEIVIFNATVAENIAFGDPTASPKAIEEAARLANAHEFIAKLPQGYDTLLGEGGVSLSGGQKQRLAIARAILKNPPILILDEATSHLDPISEKLVQEALSHLMQGRTTIAIAHRLSTIKAAHKIVVLNRGRVIAEGPHEHLLSECQLYRRLYGLFEGR